VPALLRCGRRPRVWPWPSGTAGTRPTVTFIQSHGGAEQMRTHWAIHPRSTRPEAPAWMNECFDQYLGLLTECFVRLDPICRSKAGGGFCVCHSGSTLL